jgi:hypothetical protein
MTRKPYYPTKNKVTATLLFKAMLGNVVRPIFWQRGKFLPAFWTIVSVFSLVVNAILIAVLISFGQQLFTLKNTVSTQLVTGLSDNFKLMNEAVIDETIIVDDTIPVEFVLPVKTSTWVVLTEPARIDGAQVNISAGVININAPANIILPAGTRLPIALDISVEVDETVPVHLEVPVYIPLRDTGLGEPFEGLIGVVEPYELMLTELEDSWADTPLCQGDLNFLCGWFLVPESDLFSIPFP